MGLSPLVLSLVLSLSKSTRVREGGHGCFSIASGGWRCLPMLEALMS